MIWLWLLFVQYSILAMLTQYNNSYEAKHNVFVVFVFKQQEQIVFVA